MRAETATTIPGLVQQKASVKIQKHQRKVKSFDKVEIGAPLPTFRRYLATQKPLAPVHPAVHETIDQKNGHAFQYRQRRENPDQIYMQLPTIPKVETQIPTVETPDVRPSSPVNTSPSHTTPDLPTTPPARRFHLSPMCQSTPKGRAAGRPLLTIPTTLSYGPLRVAPVQPKSSTATKLQIKVASLTPTEPRRRIQNTRFKPFTPEPQRAPELKNTKLPRSAEMKSPTYYDDEGTETSVDGDQESVVYEANTIPTAIDFSNISLDDDSVPICNSTYADDIQSESTIAFNYADERPSISGASSPDSSASEDESTILSLRAMSDRKCTCSAYANKDNTSTTSSWASSHVFMSTVDSHVTSCMFWTLSDSDDSLAFTNQDISMRKLPNDDETSIDTMRQRVPELKTQNRPDQQSPMYYDDEGTETSVDGDQESVVYEANTIPTEIEFSNISLDDDSVPICNSTYDASRLLTEILLTEIMDNMKNIRRHNSYDLIVLDQ